MRERDRCYRFELLTADGWVSRVDPRAREVTHSMGDGIMHDPVFDWNGDAPRAAPATCDGDLRDARRDGGSAGPTRRAPATFDDAVGVLDHLVRLGINDVQLMPVAEFAGDRSWGYNPATSVRRRAGVRRASRVQALRQGSAPARHLGVILDVVYNHFGPDDLHLWRFDGWSEHDGGGIYFYNDHRAETPWGQTRPDYGRDEVRGFICDNALMWLEEYHVDGLRLDMTLYMRTVNGEAPRSWVTAGR